MTCEPPCRPLRSRLAAQSASGFAPRGITPAPERHRVPSRFVADPPASQFIRLQRSHCHGCLRPSLAYRTLAAYPSQSGAAPAAEPAEYFRRRSIAHAGENKRPPDTPKRGAFLHRRRGCAPATRIARGGPGRAVPRTTAENRKRPPAHSKIGRPFSFPEAFRPQDS